MPLADFSLAVIAWLMICAIGMALVVSGRDPQSKKTRMPWTSSGLCLQHGEQRTVGFILKCDWLKRLLRVIESYIQGETACANL